MTNLTAQGAPELPPLPAYDAGLLSDFGGGSVDWWQDYIRAEARAEGDARYTLRNSAAAFAEGAAFALKRAALTASEAEAVTWEALILNKWTPTTHPRHLEMQGFQVRAVSEAEAVKVEALTHEEITAAGLGLEYVHSVLRWAACGYVNTPEQIANLHTAYRIVDKLVNATPSPSPAATQEPYYLWSHPRETARVCRPSEATFAAGDPEWVREYPVEGHERADAQVQEAATRPQETGNRLFGYFGDAGGPL